MHLSDVRVLVEKEKLEKNENEEENVYILLHQLDVLHVSPG